MPTNNDRAILEACEDPATTTWFKSAALSALDRDPVDAANDAEELARLLSERAGRMVADGLQAAAIEPDAGG